EHQCEACQGQTEDSLHEKFTSCTKNPDHALFIPVTAFTIEHLPEHYRDNDLFELIKVVAELTVRIAVSKVSPNRPEFWPDTKKEYPFYKDKGQTFLRTGTGEMDLFMYKDGHGFHPTGSSYNSFTGTSYEAPYKTCPCEKCQQSDKPSNVWLEIQIHTAAHVVFDEIEAQHTSCRLFLDDHASPKVTFKKVDHEGVDFQRDKCYLKYITCDETIGKCYLKYITCDETIGKCYLKYITCDETIGKCYLKYITCDETIGKCYLKYITCDETIGKCYLKYITCDETIGKCYLKYITCDETIGKCYLKYITCDDTIGKRLHEAAGKKDLLWSQVLDKFGADKLTFIVSHPHGFAKQVSIGEWTEHIKVREYNEDFDMTKLIYTTCTCSGSSGARAYCVGIINSHVHNGVLTSGLNYSSVDVFRK
ncbi:RNA polymerase II-associated protein 3, partial [Biomphalaria glabrata]